MPVTKRETEFSKAWARSNPVFFTENVLSFLEKHPSKTWEIEFTQTTGFFSLIATKLVAETI